MGQSNKQRSHGDSYHPTKYAKLMFVYGYIFSICQHTTSRLCPTNRDESIHLSEGEPLLVRCPGKSIGVTITGKGAGSWNVELQDSEDCSTSSKPESNSIDRTEGIDYEAFSLPTSFRTQVIGELIIIIPANQSKFAVIITKPY